MPAYLLAIDNGTQSVRALLFDLQGNLVDKAQVASHLPVAPAGLAGNDPEAFWQSLCQACQQLWASTAVAKSDIAGVVITTQRGTTVSLDRHGQPLRPAMIWLDQRRAEQAPRLSWWWEAALQTPSACATPCATSRSRGRGQLDRPAPARLWAQTDKFLLLSGYLNYRLTGRMVDSVASQVGYVPFDYKKGRWAAAHDWKWQALPIQPQHAARAGARRHGDWPSQPRGRRAKWTACGPAGDCRCRRQGLRSAWRRLPGA
jgi:sugar (pentulose or hexulose) kinase